MLFKSLFTLAAISFGAVKAQDNNNNATQNLAEILSTNTQTTQLYKVLNSSYPDLIATLQGNNSNATYTLFAPADTAFTAQVLALLPTITDLQDLIRYHIVNGSFLSTNLADGPNIVGTIVNNGSLSKWSNATGLSIDIFKNSSSSNNQKRDTTTTSAAASPSSSTGIELLYGFNSANVITADIKGSNGVIHLIDKVLSFPQSPSLTLASNTDTSNFQQAASQSGAGSTFDNQNGITIFVPNNAAFGQTNFTGLSNDTLAHLLKYHAIGSVYYTTNLTGLAAPTNFTTLSGDNITITVSGSDITVGNSNTTGKVITSNILTDNGVIHIIDTILFYPNNTNSSNNNGNGSSSAASTSQISTMAFVFSTITVVCALFL